jgi:L-alanine-DL-glutamate epimerase-like enolase superfamily enzyme
MKITAIETFPVRIPLKPARRMISALGKQAASELLIIRVLTDGGVEGVGEATVAARWSGETVWTAKSIVEDVLAPAVIGLDPSDILTLDRHMDRVCVHNWFAKSAIEMACWDIQGKVAATPVYELLGGACRPHAMRCRFSIGAYPPDRTRQRAQELIQEGFTTLKVKVGTVFSEDIERVRIVREVAGPTIDLVIDANCGFDAATAIAAAKELEDCNVGLFEQPTPDGDYAAIAEVRRAIKPLVMADDMCFNLIHAKELVRNAGCDVISVYPGKNGGIRKSKEIVEFAGEHGVACSIGSNLEFDIATAAMCHLAVACPNVQLERFPGDILGPDYHEFSIAKNPILIRGPIVTISDQPGLGIDVDWKAVRDNMMS